jgi:preprotein translocase subunit SecA
MLNVIDGQWKDHLLSMDHLKEGIGLRGYGQKDPLIEYKKESFELFNQMKDRIVDETVRILFFLQPSEEAPPLRPPGSEGDDAPELVGAGVRGPRQSGGAAVELTRNIQRKKQKELDQIQFIGSGKRSTAQQPVLKGKKVGRNDPCPCGSGKKYKKCCGA